MSKVRINSTLINLTENEKTLYEGLGIKNDNKLQYIDNNIVVTLILKEDIILKRKSKEYEITMNFKDNDSNGSYNIFEFNSNIPLEIITKKISKEINKITIEYRLYIDKELMGDYIYELSYEVI